jgi:hypothetical protein
LAGEGQTFGFVQQTTLNAEGKSAGLGEIFQMRSEHFRLPIKPVDCSTAMEHCWIDIGERRKR